jgi:hypothetical protein
VTKHRDVLSLYYYLFNTASLKSAGNVRNLWLMSISFTNDYVAEHKKLLPSLHSHICSRNYFAKTVANQNIDLYNSVHKFSISDILTEN